jgi:hypothetical protein
MERVRNIEPMYQPKDILPQASIPRKINKQPLKHNTQNNYIYLIKKIHKYYTNEDIKDNDDIIKAIKGEPFNYKNVVKQFPYFLNERYIYDFIIRWTKQLREVAGIFSRINGFTFFRKRIVPYIDVLNKIQQDKRDATTIDEDVKLKLSFNHNDILPNLDKLSNNYEKLLYLLLTLIPTRRAHDYRYTKNSSSIPNDTIDKSFNYYFDKHIYIFNTKNKKFFDLLLPDEIIPYINTQTEFIFGDKLITHDKMSNNIKSIFKKIYGHPYNATLIRRLYATYSRENLTKKQIKLNAIAMGHSLTENLNYTFD